MSTRLVFFLALLVMGLALPGCANPRAAADSVWGGFQGMNSDVQNGGAWGPTDHDWKEPVGGR